MRDCGESPDSNDPENGLRALVIILILLVSVIVKLFSVIQRIETRDLLTPNALTTRSVERVVRDEGNVGHE